MSSEPQITSSTPPTTPHQLSAIAQEQSLTTQESGFRYAAYANRFKTLLLASHRYVAYTSDIGESFRPVAHPYLVSFGYAISGLYVLGDVSYASWLTKRKAEGTFIPGLKPWDKLPEPNKQASEEFIQSYNGAMVDTDWRLVALKRGVFQGLASLALPAFTIHSAVRSSSYLFKNTGIRALRTYGPVAIGLGIVPLLPYVFDEPVEKMVDWVFEKGEEVYKGGKLNKNKLQ